MDTKRLEEIKQRCARATKGPWEKHVTRDLGGINPREHVSVIASEPTGLVEILRTFARPPHTFPRIPAHENAEFAAHARTDVPDLVAEVERLRTELAETQELAQDQVGMVAKMATQLRESDAEKLRRENQFLKMQLAAAQRIAAGYRKRALALAVKKESP